MPGVPLVLGCWWTAILYAFALLLFTGAMSYTIFELILLQSQHKLFNVRGLFHALLGCFFFGRIMLLSVWAFADDMGNEAVWNFFVDIDVLFLYSPFLLCTPVDPFAVVAVGRPSDGGAARLWVWAQWESIGYTCRVSGRSATREGGDGY